MALTSQERSQRWWQKTYPEGKITTTAMTVGGKQYNLPSIKQKGNWKNFIKFIQEWKKNPTLKNFLALSNKLDRGSQDITRKFRRWLRGETINPRGSGIWDQKTFEAINKDLNLSTNQISKLKSYTRSAVDIEKMKKAKIAHTARTPLQKGTNDYPEIVKIFDKYKYNTNISNLKNQDAIIAQLKNNPILAARFKQEGIPLTLENLKTRIARTHNAVISNSLNKKSFPGVFEGLSIADRQNFLKNSENIFRNIINRSFQGQLLETLKGNELKLATDKYSKFSTLKKFLSDRMGHLGGARGEAFIQMDHPISLAVLDKTKNLNQALRVNPIAGDINQWKRKLDSRLSLLQTKGDVKGLRALNEVNQVLFGKGFPSFTVGTEGISKIKGLPADFRKANVLEQLRGNVGLHETLKENIKLIPEETWKTSGVRKATTIGELEALKSWDPKVLTRLINEWTEKNPKWTKILEKRIGCQSGCLAAVGSESPAAFSEVLKKTPAAARSFLGMLGRGGVRAAPYAALAAAGAAIEPLVKQFRSDDPNTYLTDESQMKGMLLATIEGETPKVDEEILKWQYPGLGAATAAGAIPGAGEVYKARRGLPPTKDFIGPMKKGVGKTRAALGITGVLGKALGASFSPLAVLATLPVHVAAQRAGGTEYKDIATDPFNWMGPAFASTGAQMATRGMKDSSLIANAIRLGFSPKTLSRFTRRFGLPGLAVSAGLWGYDKWKNRSVNDE